MNCRQFQHDLDEYSEGSLGAPAQAAAEEHLAACAACRQRLQEEQAAARSLREGMHRATEGLELPPEVGRRVLAALKPEREHRAPNVQQPTTNEPASVLQWVSDVGGRILDVAGWGRRGWAAALAAWTVAMLAGWFFAARQTGPGTHPAPPRPLQAAISVQLSFVEPAYTFRRDDGHVVDALTTHTKVINEKVPTVAGDLH